MKNMQRVISLVLMLSILAGFFPADILGIGTTAQAEAPDSTVVEAKGFSGMPEQAAQLADQGASQTEDGWQYVRIPDTDYAAVVGYTDLMATELEMPDVFGDLDVVAVAPGALSALKQLETIYIPGNVRAMGEKALPRGTSVKAMNAAYAAAWAGENGYPYVNASSYEFREGVVDLSDVRTDNFVRLSESEVWLRNLEATRLKKGSFFFLVDPANAYQISYYKVTAITDMQNGFTCFTCETPEVDSILYHYEGKNELFVPDMDSIILYSGTHIQTSEDEVSASSSLSIGNSALAEIHLSLNPEIELSDHTSLEFEIGVSKKYSGSFEIGLFTDWNYTIKDEDSTFLKAALSPSYTDPETEMVKDGAKDFVKETSMTRQSLLKRETMKEALKSVRGAHYTEEELSIPMAELILFSYAGLVNLTGTVNFVVELSGEISFTFESTSTTTFSGQKGREPTKSVKPGVRKITGEVTAELKIGVDVGLNFLLGPVNIFTASMFIGLKAEAGFELESSTGALGSRGVNEFDLFATAALEMGSGQINLPDEINFNMLDCITVKVSFVVEAGVKLGIGSLVELANTKVTLIDIRIWEGHLHMFPYEYQIEDYPDDLTEWEAKESFAYYRESEKDNFHTDLECPYEEKTVSIYGPWRTEKMELYKQYRETPNAMFDEPSESAVNKNRKLLGWYSDPSFTNGSFIKSWPVKLAEDKSFYARSTKYHKVYFVDANGKILDYENYEGMTYSSLKATADGLDSSEKTGGWAGKLADGEYVILPAVTYSNTTVRQWVQVVSAKNRTPVASNVDELGNTSYDSGDRFYVNEKTEDVVWLCAITDRDVAASFYTGVGGTFIYLFLSRGDSFTAPACEETMKGYRFAGWEETETGTVVVPGETVVTDCNTPAKLNYDAVWEPNGETTTPESFDNYIGSTGIAYPGSSDEPSNPEEVFAFTTNGNAITITGLNSPYNTTVENLRIPARINNIPVTQIASAAFKGNTINLAIK